ncbi:MAG: hypothetical protein AAF697_03690 [Pseudomonadota bacterium]
MEHVGALPFNDQGRYQPTSTDDTVHSVFVDSPSYPIRLQLARIRRSDLPLVEEAGSVSALDISQKAGIMDWCHIVITDDGYAVAEFNRDAPRIAALGEYLLFKSGGIIPSALRFLPLFQRSVIAELESFESITVLEIEALTTEASAIAKGDEHIGAAFAACSELGAVRKAEMRLKTARQPTLDLKGIAGRLFSNPFSRESLTRLKAFGPKDGRRKELDLLQQYKILNEDFIRLNPRSKAVDSTHAFQVLENAFEKARSTLGDAVSIDGAT